MAQWPPILPSLASIFMSFMFFMSCEAMSFMPAQQPLSPMQAALLSFIIEQDFASFISFMSHLPSLQQSAQVWSFAMSLQQGHSSAAAAVFPAGLAGAAGAAVCASMAVHKRTTLNNSLIFISNSFRFVT